MLTICNNNGKGYTKKEYDYRVGQFILEDIKIISTTFVLAAKPENIVLYDFELVLYDGNENVTEDNFEKINKVTIHANGLMYSEDIEPEFEINSLKIFPDIKRDNPYSLRFASTTCDCYIKITTSVDVLFDIYDPMFKIRAKQRSLILDDDEMESLPQIKTETKKADENYLCKLDRLWDNGIDNVYCDNVVIIGFGSNFINIFMGHLVQIFDEHGDTLFRGRFTNNKIVLQPNRKYVVIMNNYGKKENESSL